MEDGQTPQPDNAPERALTFSEALDALKLGYRITRSTWKGDPALPDYLYLVSGSRFEVSRPPLSTHLPEGSSVEYMPHIDSFRASPTFGQIAAVYQVSQADLLADDWRVLQPPEETPAQAPSQSA